MWDTNSLWFEVACVSIFFMLGHMFFGHFIEREAKWRRVAKYILTLGIVLLVSIYFGRRAAFILLGLSIIPLIYVHGFVLPRKGINGWTGEPKSRYYDFRGWDKDVFKE